MPSTAHQSLADTEGSPLLTLREVTKTFPAVVAVDRVDLSVAQGEIVALLGANGAGKSTLIQVLSGVHPAGTWSGSIDVAGRAFAPSSVAEAEAAGIAFLAQEVNVAPDLTVAETMSLNSEPTRFGLIDRPLQLKRAREALASFDVNVDPSLSMGDLDLATQQLVLIVRALSKNARLLILDEPTAALTDREAERLFDRMRALKGRGVAIIFVTHRLAEVFSVSDRIVVMRDGRISGAAVTANTTRDAVVAQMVGSVAGRPKASASRGGAVALQALGLTVLDPDSGRTLVDRADLELRHGEIVGLFGLLGSGVVETAMALFGAWRGSVSGTIQLDGRPVVVTDPSLAVQAGIGLIAQDRRDGLSADHSILDNAILANLQGISTRAGFIDVMAARRQTQDLFDRLNIKANDIDTLVGELSGGNQQKVQVARWLAAGVGVLLLIDPTRGVDVGARSEVNRIWRELADDGRAILLVSSDAEELVETVDRVLIMRGGRITQHLDRDALSEEALLRFATGV
jgi:ABC-type sugar transport system ATPase subunit